MGTGYTRNDTANNIADGNVINASDLDGEFDAVQAAFNGTTGHSHDGTSGEGPQIGTAGIANSAVTLAKMATNSVDSDQYVDGSIDTVHIANDAVTGDKLANNIQIAGTLGVTGETTLSTHLNMGDNDIIKLGAGADLQIFHDAVNSYISEQGTGSLRIRGTNLFLQDTSGNDFIGLTDNGTGGRVTLYHNTVQTLATSTTGIDVTGNITVSGNVDGRDVASDGTKLDGIESGATADQTASEILTLIKTVDGSGSGLDADTLDGVSSGSFLRSDTGDSASQRMVFNANNTNNWDTIATATGSLGAIEVFNNGASNDAFMAFHVGSDFALYFGLDGGINDLAVGGWSMGANSYRIWHQGNDGSGSGLDSDTVDGVQASSFLRSDAADIKTSGNLIFNDNIKAEFGTSSDLQIHHDGSNSYITHNTTGNLYIRQNRNDGDIFIQSDNSSGGVTNYLTADGSTGKTLLYQYGSEKLRTESDGIYVTGNVQSSTGQFEGASNADRINIEASNINYYINGNNEFRMESDGDFHADGDVVAFSTTVSDERLKTDIEKIENATDKVSQLNGYTFTYKADGKKSAGVIAQEVEKVLPSAVSEKELPLKMDDGIAYKTVQYDQIIGLLIESIKELKQEINELKGA